MGNWVIFVTLVRRIEPCVADPIICAADLHTTGPQTGGIGVACHLIQKICPLSIGDFILTDVVAVSGLTYVIALADNSFHAGSARRGGNVHRLDL